MKCTSCPLSDNPDLKSNCIDGRGPKNPDFMFIGVVPGIEEDRRGIVWCGKNAELMDELLREAGLDPSSVRFSNCLRCYNPNGSKVNKKWFEACKKHLLNEIKEVQPKAIVSVGKKANEWLASSGGTKKLRRHGFPCKIKEDLHVYPMGQPAQLFHTEDPLKTKLRTEMVNDLLWLKDRRDRGRLSITEDIPTDYKTARTVEDVDEFLNELYSVEEVSCDLETTALFPDEGERITAIGFSKGAGHGRSIPLYAYGELTLNYWEDSDLKNEIIPRLKLFLQKRKVFGHNFLQFDQKWIKKEFNIDRCNITYDTMLAHYLTDEEKGTHDLEQLALLYTTMLPWKRDFDSRDTDALCKYNCKDVDATWRVRNHLDTELTHAQRWLLKEILIPLGHVLMEMEYAGVYVDDENLELLGKHLDGKIDEVMQDIHKIPEVQAYELNENTAFNVDSRDHLALIMEKYFKFPCIQKTAKGKYSTRANVLAALSDRPFIQHVQKMRGLSKLKGTYYEGIKRKRHLDGRLHTSFLIHGTVTGRLSSTSPNLQNIPRADTVGKVLDDGTVVKKIFSARDGYILLNADFSQAELRTLAMYSKDPTLIEIFQEGQDVHSATAAKVYGVEIDQVKKLQRTEAKSVNFGIIYGRSPDSIAEQFEKAGSSRDSGYKFVDFHKSTFPKVWEFMSEQEALIKEYGYQETFFGRRRRFQFLDDHSIRQAYNFPIQSTANEFTLIALIRCDMILKELSLPARPLLTVHDSILFEIKMDQFWEAAEVIKEVMEGIDYSFMIVPMTVDMEAGLTWGSLREIDLEKRKLMGTA
jgi:DNA polymerase-1